MSTIDIRRAAQYATVAENAAAQCVIVADNLQANVEELTGQATDAAQQAVASQAAAKASETASKSSQTSASASAASAAQSAAEAASSAAATGYVAPPFPDVWAPLSDDLKMISGYPVNNKLLSFTRASTATYIDKSGVLQTAPVNEARFEKQGLLIEGQATNLVPNSASTSPTWKTANATAVSASIVSPDGTTNGVTRLASSGGSNTQTGSAITVPVAGLAVGGYCSFSVFAKADSHNLIQLRWAAGSTGVSSRYLNVDLSTGEVGSNTLFIAKTIPMNNGWWRIIAVTTIDGDLTGGSSADPGVELISSLSDGRRPAVTLSTGIGVYLYGPQLEAGTFTSYIPTSGSAVTRAADDCTAQRSGNDNYFGPVTIAAEVHCNGQTATDGATSSRRGILAAYPTTNDNIILMVDSSASTAGKYAFAYGSAAFNYSDNRIDDGQTHTVCSRSTTLQNQSCVDGTLLTSPTPVSRPTPGTTSSVNQLFYIGRGAGATASGSRMLNGHIRNLRIWHRSLSDIQMKGIR